MASKLLETLSPTPMPTRLSRRDLLGFAAKGAASVVVSQSLLAACASSGTSATDTSSSTDNTGASGSSGSATCVLTAALTEGPFFVDEKLNRADIRTDPATGIVSAGIPLALTFNVQRVATSACTPLTGAYLDVWHCD
jgi:protocatechuate 3,4-dioxygenase beta subunit